MIVTIAIFCLFASAMPSFGITAEEFNQLSADDKATVLEAGVRSWLDRTKNLAAVTETKFHKVEVDENIVVTRRIKEFARRWHDFRRVGDSYRLRQKWWTEKALGGDCVTDSTSVYDAKRGVVRSLVHHKDIPGEYGWILAQEAPECFMYDYGRILDVSGPGSSHLPLSFLLERPEEWQFPVSEREGLILAEMEDHNSDDSGRTSGVRRMWFDPAKGFLLVLQTRLLLAVPDGPKWKVRWHRRYDVTESREVGGVWLPSKTVLTTFVPHKGWGITREVTLEKAELGTVTESDLVVDFPVGAEVIDKVNGRQYFVGDEDAISDPQGGDDTSGATRNPLFLMATLTGLTIVLALGLRFSRRKRANRGK